MLSNYIKKKRRELEVKSESFYHTNYISYKKLLLILREANVIFYFGFALGVTVVPRSMPDIPFLLDDVKFLRKF